MNSRSTKSNFFDDDFLPIGCLSWSPLNIIAFSSLIGDKLNKNDSQNYDKKNVVKIRS